MAAIINRWGTRAIMKCISILLLGATLAHAEVRYNLDRLTATEKHIRPFIADIFQACYYGRDPRCTQIYPGVVKYWSYLRTFDTRAYDFSISYIHVTKTVAACAYVEVAGYLQIGDFSDGYASTGRIQTSWNIVLDNIWFDKPALRMMRESGLCDLRSQLAEENDPGLKSLP